MWEAIAANLAGIGTLNGMKIARLIHKTDIQQKLCTDGERRERSEKEDTRREIHPAEHQHGAGAAEAAGRSLPQGGTVHVLGDPAGPGRLYATGTSIIVAYRYTPVHTQTDI